MKLWLNLWIRRKTGEVQIPKEGKAKTGKQSKAKPGERKRVQKRTQTKKPEPEKKRMKSI